MFAHDLFRQFPMTRRRTADLDTLFEQMFRAPHARSRAFPPVNVHESPETIVVMVELPGVDADQLDVKVQNDTLILSGERVADRNDGGRLLRNERWHGNFVREVALPSKVQSSSVEAEYRQGVLTITLPKAAEAKPQIIKVKSV